MPATPTASVESWDCISIQSSTGPCAENRNLIIRKTNSKQYAHHDALRSPSIQILDDRIGTRTHFASPQDRRTFTRHIYYCRWISNSFASIQYKIHTLKIAHKERRATSITQRRTREYTLCIVPYKL